MTNSENGDKIMKKLKMSTQNMKNNKMAANNEK